MRSRPAVRAMKSTARGCRRLALGPHPRGGDPPGLRLHSLRHAGIRCGHAWLRQGTAAGLPGRRRGCDAAAYAHLADGHLVATAEKTRSLIADAVKLGVVQSPSWSRARFAYCRWTWRVHHARASQNSLSRPYAARVLRWMSGLNRSQPAGDRPRTARTTGTNLRSGGEPRTLARGNGHGAGRGIRR